MRAWCGGFTLLRRQLVAQLRSQRMLVLCTYTVALAALTATGFSAEEMTEAEAIAEIKRLGGDVYEYVPPKNTTGRTKPPPLVCGQLGDEHTDEQLRLLNFVHTLEVLRVPGTSISDDSLASLKALTRLRVLSLGPKASNITDGGLEHIGVIGGITDLSLDGANVTDVGFAHIAKLGNLRQLQASGSGVTDAALGKLATLAKLTSLSLSETTVTNAGLALLRRLTKLTSLEIHSTAVRDGAIAELRGLPLTDLSIGDGITDAGLKDLNAFPNLQSLSLADLPITDVGLKELPLMTTLTRLNLSATKISDLGLKELRRLTGAPGTRGDGAKSGRGYPGLKELHLEHTAITDAGLKELETLPHLPRLYLAGTKVTDAGMDSLQRATRASIMSWPGQSRTSGSSGGRPQPRAGKP